MPLDNGAVFAGFRIVRPLGSGGMGEVYLAQHPRLPRREALKILSSTVSADTVFRERFNREADIVASLSHPHIVGVHDRGEFDGQLWISMEYIDGTDAARLIRNRYPAGMPAAEAVEIVTAVAGALDYAHQQGLLHRDIKPANMLLTRPDDEGQRQVFLADFGIARELADPSGLTATNIAVGTVAYAAPEQLMGQQLDGRADQYGLAATAFHMLTGAPPPVVVGQHLNAPIPKLSDFRPDLAGLDQAMSTALARNPYQRFSSCRDFAKALREHVPAAAVGEHTTQAAPTPADVRRRRRVSVSTVVSGVIAAALVVLTTVALRFADPDRKPAAEPTNTASPSATALPVPTLPTNEPPPQLPAPPPYTPPAYTLTQLPALQLPAQTPITFDGMRDFVIGYYDELPQDPMNAWTKLDTHYQEKTGSLPYLDFWATIQSVTVISVSPRDATSVIAQCKYVKKDGQSFTDNRWLRMVLVNGQMQVDDSELVG